jgi:aspartyl-tRNA(Asn)/glutamyl-tRNA(Gln) amidotransferase subunit B
MKFEAVIGLEVHVQLKTRTKMFTRVPYCYGAPPNTLTDEIVLGLPGTLPTLNKAAILKTIQMGLLFGSRIPPYSRWDRKNYFYPDLPKNYQISQYENPLCEGGTVEIELPGPARNIQGLHQHIRLNRIHLEEDVGKLIHVDEVSQIDFNRAGTPLVEIVSEPDLHTGEEVFAYLKSLITHLQYLEASDCDMEKGQLRCDANVSVRPVGEQRLGTKVELKNLNSVSGVCNGVAHEIERQIRVLEGGQNVLQESRRWDAEKGISVSMRSKEEAHDYRYFPDPDLKPIRISEELKNSLREHLPEPPFTKQERYQREYGLPYTVTSVLCPDVHLAKFFEAAVSHYGKNPQAIANWIANDLVRERGEPWERLKITPVHVAELVRLTDDGVISKQSAKTVFTETFKTGQPPEILVDRLGLRMVHDSAHLESTCREVIRDFPRPAAEFRSGKEKALHVLKGQVIKRTQGRIDPATIDDLLRRLLS